MFLFVCGCVVVVVFIYLSVCATAAIEPLLTAAPEG